MRKRAVLLALLIAAGAAHARGENGRKPCDRNAGGPVACQGEKFVCANGKISGSKKVCSGLPQR